MRTDDLPDFPLDKIDSSIFEEYIALGKKVSYSLQEYHFAVLLTIASMALRRVVVAQVGIQKVWANVFTIVSGHTTISGKTYACNIGIDNIGPAIVFEEPIAKHNSVNIVRGTFSEASLLQTLNDTYNLLWFYDDCATFFTELSQWNNGLVSKICSVYDGNPQEKTLSKRGKSKDNTESYKWSCPRPFVSILFNTTNKNVEETVNGTLIDSGLLPRMLWFYGKGGKSKRNNDVQDEDTAILAKIKHDVKELRLFLSNLQDNSIIFLVNDTIEDWKISRENEYLDSNEYDAHRAAIGRAFIHCYKIAMILSMLDKDFRKILGTEYPIKVQLPKKHVDTAIAVVEGYLLPRTVRLMNAGECNNSKNFQLVVLQALDQLGGKTTRSKLLKKTRLAPAVLTLAISTLEETGEIKIWEEKGVTKTTKYVERI